MGQKPPVQKSQEDPTAWIKLEDQSLATNKAGVAVPFGSGEHKTVGAPLTGVYGWSAVRTSTGGGKGGKGGQQTSTTYRGTIAFGFCIGPAWSLERMLVNGIRAYEGHLAKVGGEDFADITVEGFGAATLYWGTETQVADPALEAFEPQPGRRGKVYLVWKNASFGPNGETQAPTIEAFWRRIPQQTVIDNTGGAAENDGAFTANGLAIGAEIYTSWHWMNRPASELDAASWQATADALQALRAEGQSALTDSDRSAVAIAPLWTERIEAHAAFQLIARATDAWFRFGANGKIQAGYWKRTIDLGTVTDLGPDDVTEIPKPARGDALELSNSFIVEFTDSGRHHKSNCVTVNNNADVRNRGVRRQTIKRPELLREYQARMAGAEARRSSEIPDLSIELSVKRAKCKNPDGSAIRPGDYFRYPVQLLSTDPVSLALFRCIRRDFNQTGPIRLRGELEKLAPLSAVVPDEPIVEIPNVMPPVYYRRPISFRHEDFVAANSPLFILAARPDAAALNARVLYGATIGGDYSDIGAQPSYALPVSLPQAIAAADTTVRVKLLPLSAAGADPRRDSGVLTDWQGGSSEGNDDTLLLILLSKSGGAIVTQEICSINGPASVVATDTYDVPVKRGRRWSTAIAFSAGSFPDAFANYEGWIIRRDQLEAFSHADWLNVGAGRPTIYLRYTPFGLSKVYDGTSAFDEYTRRVAATEDLEEYEFQTDATHQPTDTFSFPVVTATAPDYTDMFVDIAPTFSVYHRERSGTARVVGHAEYVDGNPATEPEPRYLTEIILSGQHGSCTDTGGRDLDRSRNSTYYPTSSDLNPAPVVVEPSGSVLTVCSGNVSNVHTTTKTTDNYDASDSANYISGCCTSGNAWTGTSYKHMTLSNPDSEAAAITRLMDSIGAWSTVSWVLCTAFQCGLSTWQARGATGVTFSVGQGQIKIDASGLAVDGYTICRVPVYRANHGSTTWVLYEEQAYSFTADGAGNASISFDLPNQRGYAFSIGVPTFQTL